jgi:hypothetical protein
MTLLKVFTFAAAIEIAMRAFWMDHDRHLATVTCGINGE